jgi:hypothetical protein
MQEIYEFCKSHKLTFSTFLDYVYVYERVKPGTTSFPWKKDIPKEGELLINLLKKAGLYVSTKHRAKLKNIIKTLKERGQYDVIRHQQILGNWRLVYITNNELLYRRWEDEDPLQDPLTFDAESFLGYPDCCVHKFRKFHKSTDVKRMLWFQQTNIDNLLQLIQLGRKNNLSEIKRIITTIAISGNMLHVPCSLHCIKTHYFIERIRQVLIKYWDVASQNYNKNLEHTKLEFTRKLQQIITPGIIFNEIRSMWQSKDPKKEYGVTRDWMKKHKFVEIIGYVTLKNNTDEPIMQDIERIKRLIEQVR